MKILEVHHDLLYKSNRFVINYPKEDFDSYANLYESVGVIDKDAEYEITIRKKRSKRSMNANAYSWVLTGKLADEMRISKDECHALMLARYGQTAVDSHGKPLMISVSADVPLSEVTSKVGYVAPLATHGFIGNKEFIHYRVLRGSSDYNSEEMAVFIDGLVDECKLQGIQTLTDREIDSMIEDWGAR